VSEEQQQKRPWWLAVITIPNVLAIGGLLLGGAMAVQADREQAQQLRDRMERVERRQEADAVNNALIYMRRDVLVEQLRLIQEEQMRQRELIQAMRRDLR
jgi:hypothetical protein